jgi:myo-inositol-1(or 4)-monophosphatase
LPGTDLDLLLDAAQAAGKVATRYVGTTAKRWDKPEGAGPVTEADIAVNDMLHAQLTAARPDYGWLSEESPDSADRLDREAVFIIDPIDGTRSFAEGSRTWAHSIAIARGGVVSEAVIYLPRKDMLFAARAGAGATLNGAPIAASVRAALDGAEVLATKPNMEPRHWPRGAPGIRRAHRPSLAYRMALVAQGRFDGMLTLRPTWEWDVAAGDLILREAGATVTDRAGGALRFNNAHPQVDGIVAGGAPLHRAMLEALAP